MKEYLMRTLLITAVLGAAISATSLVSFAQPAAQPVKPAQGQQDVAGARYDDAAYRADVERWGANVGQL